MYSWLRSSCWRHHSRLFLFRRGFDWDRLQSRSLFAKYLTRSCPTGQWTSLHLGVVLFSVVPPWRSVEDDPVVVGDGDEGKHCLQISRSWVLHDLAVVRVAGVLSSGAITSVSVEILCGNSITYQWCRRKRLRQIPVLPVCRFGVHSSLSSPSAGWSLTKPHLECTWCIIFVIENCMWHRMCCMF
jgi:hypothetical protein